jgi:peptidoglycan lytic transglycosylase
MRRFRANSLLVLACIACLVIGGGATAEPVGLSANSVAKPVSEHVSTASRHAKSKTGKKSVASKAKATSIAKKADMPLPDRNPNPTAAPANPDTQTEATAPAPPQETLQGDGSSPAAPQATQAAVADPAMPLPDANPRRPSSTSSARLAPPPTAKPGAISIPSQAPAMDFATVLKPLLNYEISAADEANLKEAIRLAYRGDGSSQALTAKIKDDAVRKLATWYAYKGSGLDISAAKIEEFRLTNPQWPGQDELRERAEAALLLDDASPEEVKAFFKDKEPTTGAGKAALGGAILKENEAEGRAKVASAWRDYHLNSTVEKKILARFGDFLTTNDYQARVDRLLYGDNQSAAEAALRVSKLLPAAEQKKVAARIAILKRGGNAGKLLDALPASATQGDVGLLYNRIQWLRRKDRDEEAWKILLDVPNEPDKLLDLENWWIERRMNCRAALNAGQPRVAYEIAVEHGPLTGDPLVEAEFLAGWIALRFLAQPKDAFAHFVASRSAAKSSKQVALAEYWLGRAALALGDRGNAIVHFHAAAKYPQFFYGQLGRQALDSKPASLEVTPTKLPTQADIDSFFANDAVRAIGIALASDMDQVTPQFFLALSRKLTNPAEVVLLAELARLAGNPQISLRLSKIAFNRDLPVGDYALPIGVLPEIKSLRLDERVDLALVHALSRQESEFNAGAKSPVGASGLMQLMPATARSVAKSYKVQFQSGQLTNPAYNMQLGEAFLGDLIDNYSGSYFLALAAYNAGGGRVQDWMEAFGDPRDPDVDPIDWIERIPFTETREYVVKIMETVQLYRSRLAGPKQALRLVQDLNRGRRVASANPAPPVEVQAKSE